MDVLHYEGTDDTPKVILNKSTGVFEISGRSLPEDSAEFYEPILNWLIEYAKDPNPTTEFMFKLEYFNTASSKLILDVLTKLEAIDGTSVIWYYHEDDEDMSEAGEEFKDLVEIEFEFRTY
jgi:hypothetical protein